MLLTGAAKKLEPPFFQEQAIYCLYRAIFVHSHLAVNIKIDRLKRNVMKRIIKVGLLMIVLTLGFNKISNAVEQFCEERTIVCMDGHGSNCRACGSSLAELQLEFAQFYTAICGSPL